MVVSGRSDETRETLPKFGRCYPFIRFGHIFLSIILALYGAALLLMTLTVNAELNHYKDFLQYYLEIPVLVMILSCMVLIAIGSLGFISSSSLIYQGIATSGVLIFGLMMFKLSMVFVVLALTNSAERSIEEALELSLENYGTKNVSIDYIQRNLLCCGVKSYLDWNSTLGFIAASCCVTENLTCEPADVTAYCSIGCHEALMNLVDFYIYNSALILGILVALEITAIMVTILLLRDIKNYRQRVVAYEESVQERETQVVEEPVIPRVKNPMAARKNILQGNGATNNTSPLSERRTNESRIRLPERRLASFNYPRHSIRVIPTARPMPRLGETYPTTAN